MWFQICLTKTSVPLGCLVGKDNNLYFRLVDLGLLLGYANPHAFASKHQSVLGEKVLPTGLHYPVHTRRCKLVNMKTFYKVLDGTPFGNLFHETLHHGKFTVVNGKARHNNYFKHCVRFVATEHGNVRFFEWLNGFVAEVKRYRQSALQKMSPETTGFETTESETVEETVQENVSMEAEHPEMPQPSGIKIEPEMRETEANDPNYWLGEPLMIETEPKSEMSETSGEIPESSGEIPESYGEIPESYGEMPGDNDESHWVPLLQEMRTVDQSEMPEAGPSGIKIEPEMLETEASDQDYWLGEPLMIETEPKSEMPSGESETLPQETKTVEQSEMPETGPSCIKFPEMLETSVNVEMYPEYILLVINGKQVHYRYVH